MEWRDHGTTKEFAERLRNKGDELKGNPDRAVRLFGESLSTYGTQRAELASKDIVQGALKVLKGGALTTLGTTGLVVGGLALGGVASGGRAGGRRRGGGCHGRRSWPLCHQHGLQGALRFPLQGGSAGAAGGAHLALLGKDRGELFNAIQEGRLDDIQIPEDMSIRGMLNVAAMFIYSMRDGFPQSLEAKPGGQICKEMLLALGLDPGSPNCRAIVRASERTELSPDEQLAFIEGHLAKTISLDLYGRSPSIAPPPGEPYSEDSSEVSNEEVVQIEDSIRLDPPSLPVPDAAPIRSDTQA